MKLDPKLKTMSFHDQVLTNMARVNESVIFSIEGAEIHYPGKNYYLQQDGVLTIENVSSFLEETQGDREVALPCFDFEKGDGEIVSVALQGEHLTIKLIWCDYKNQTSTFCVYKIKGEAVTWTANPGAPITRVYLE